MNQLRNDYAKGQKTYPATVKKLQALLTAWEGGKTTEHGSNDGLSYANVVNGEDGNGCADGNGNTQASGGQETTRRRT